MSTVIFRNNFTERRQFTKVKVEWWLTLVFSRIYIDLYLYKSLVFFFWKNECKDKKITFYYFYARQVCRNTWYHWEIMSKIFPEIRSYAFNHKSLKLYIFCCGVRLPVQWVFYSYWSAISPLPSDLNVSGYNFKRLCFYYSKFSGKWKKLTVIIFCVVSIHLSNIMFDKMYYLCHSQVLV